MTALLYISYSSGLSEDDKLIIDRQVSRNREKVCIVVKTLASNAKDKTKKVIVVILLGGVLYFSNVQPSEAIGLSMPPAPVVRVQPNYKDTYEMEVAPTVSPKLDKITFIKSRELPVCIYNLALQLNSGSITMEEAVLQLRGGDGLTDVVVVIAFVIFINWYDSLFGVKAFQANPLSHQDPFGWLSGKYDSRNVGNGQCLSHPASRFERETLHMAKQMCHASADENGFVMSYDEAIKLLQETYPGSMQVTEDFRIGDWQAASHLYHGNGVGVDPESFGMSQAELDKLRGGFINYARKGYKLPSIEHVRAYQTSLKTICLDSTSIRHDDAEYYYKHGMEGTTVFQNDRYLVCFNQTTGDLITGDKQRPGTIRKFNETNRIGSQKWIDKWSKK